MAAAKEVGEIVVIIVYAGIVYTLVRPGSQGPKLVTSVTSGVSGLLAQGMGGSQKWSG